MLTCDCVDSGEAIMCVYMDKNGFYLSPQSLGSKMHLLNKFFLLLYTILYFMSFSFIFLFSCFIYEAKSVVVVGVEESSSDTPSPTISPCLSAMYVVKVSVKGCMRFVCVDRCSAG